MTLSACHHHLTSEFSRNLRETGSSCCPVLLPSPGSMSACLHPAVGEGLRLGRGVGRGIHVSIPGAHTYKLLSVLEYYRRSKQSNRQLQQHVKKQMSKKKRRTCPCLKFRGELTSSVTGSAWQAWAFRSRSCQRQCQVSHSCIFSCTLCQEHCFS